MKVRALPARLLAIAALAMGSVSSVISQTANMPITVNSAMDTADSLDSDGYCGTRQIIPPPPLPGGQPVETPNTCSLRAAIAEANFRPGPDTITFDLAPTGQATAVTVTLTSDLPAITSPVTIDATNLGQATVTVDGGGTSSVLQFTGTAGNSSITALTITGGLNDTATGGGAISFGPAAGSKLTLNQVVLDGNSAEPGAGIGAGDGGPGGAVSVSDGNALVVNGGSMTGNSALQGGAVYIVSNLAGPAGVADADLSNPSDDVLTLNGVTMTGNSASAGNGGAVLADLRNGGDIVVEGGVYGSGTAAATRNTASGDGGAFWINKAISSADVRLRGVTLTNNTAVNGGGVAVKLGSIQLVNTSFSANSVTGAGGGLYLDANVPSVSGGSARIENVTFSGNSATGTGAGGAIAAAALNPAQSSMIHSTVAGNTAPASNGGGIRVASAPNLTFPGSFSQPFTSNIVALNTGLDCSRSLGHSDSSNAGYNIESTTSCGFAQATDQQNTNPQLGALALNAASGVPTRRLLANSTAIDAGNPAWANAKDARGADVQDGGADNDYSNNTLRRDIGAHEFGGFGTLQFKLAAGTSGLAVDEDATPAIALIGRYGVGTAASTTPSVTLASSNGSATAGSDYTALAAPATTVSFTATGAEQFEVLRNISITNDSAMEAAETFNLALTAPNPAYVDLGRVATTMVTINDTENGSFQFDPITSMAPESAGGLNAANGAATLTVSRTAGSKGRVRLAFTLADGTAPGAATAADDYVAPSPASVVLEDGEISKSFTVELKNNTVAETAERFSVTLTAATCVDASDMVIATPKCDAQLTATTASRTNTVTIADDDGTSTLMVSDASVTEGSSGNAPLMFTVSLIPASSQTVTVSVASANGTATTADGDYTALASNVLTFAPGETSKTVVVNALGDVRFEDDETLLLNLSNVSANAAIGDAQGIGTIVNDEEIPGPGAIGFVGDCSMEPAKCAMQAATEAGTTAGTLVTKTFAVRRLGNNPTSSTAAVSFAVTNPGYSTMVAGANPAACAFNATASDYRITATGGGTAPNATTVVVNADGSGTITFNGNGNTEALINVQVCNDTRRESLQLLNLALSNATNGAQLGTASAQLTTTSDEQTRFQVAATALQVREGDDLFATIDVDALEAVDGERVCLGYKTLDGAAPNGAVSPGDYTGVDTTAAPCDAALNFANGDGASKSFSVMIIDDGATPVEPNETFSAQLSPAAGVTLVPGAESSTVTIVNQPRIAFSARRFASTDETEARELLLTLNRTGDTSGASSVQYSITTGSGEGAASFGSDFTTAGAATTGTVSFAAGTTTATIRTTVIGDDSIEGDESFTVTLSNPNNATLAADSDTTPRTATGVITDDDFRFEFAASSTTVDEGVMGGSAVITVNRVGRSINDSSVSFSLADGTALAGSDYSAPASLTVNFTAGSGGSQTLSIPLSDDSLDEVDETFTVTLANPSAPGTLGSPASNTVTITDNDEAPTLSIADIGVAEGDMGAKTLTFTATLSAASAKAVMVTATTADGTASAGSDYTSNTQMLMIPAGQTTASFEVTVSSDVLFEADENFSVNLSNPSNATLADGTATGTISNDDAAPSLTLLLTGSPAAESNGRIRVTAALSAPSGSDTVVQLAYAGTAQAADYTGAASSITVPAGATRSAELVIAPVNDTTDEADETVVIDIASNSASFAEGTPSQVTATISDDDNTPSLSVADLMVTEGNTGSVNAVFTVTLSAASSQPVSVGFTTADDTATAGSDYTAANGNVNFAAGETSKTVTVAVLGDTLDEVNESFRLVLSAPVNATLGDATGVATIVDNENAPSSASASDGQGRTVGFATSAGGFEGVSSTAQPAGAPTTLVYDNGFFTYTVAGLANGGSATVTVTLPAGSSATSYVNCPTQCIVGGSGSGTTVSITLVDGGPGDADGVANGRILVRAGAGGREPTPAGNGGGGGGSFGGSLLLVLAAALSWRRRRIAHA